MKIPTSVLIVLVFIGLLFGCRKGNDTGTASHGVFIHFIDSTGHELFVFDTVSTDGYYTDSIYLFDITKGKSVLPFCYEDMKKNYLFQALDELRTQFCPNQHMINRYSLTLVQLKRGQNDTLRCHINTDVMGPATNYDSVWYNRKLLHYDGKGNLEVMR